MRLYVFLTREVESIEMAVNQRPVPRHDGAVAVSATLCQTRGTHALPSASRPDSNGPFGSSAPDGLTSPLHVKRGI